jgi:hypothetical protein
MKTTRTTVLAILISISLLATNLSQASARREPPPPKPPVCDLGCQAKTEPVLPIPTQKTTQAPTVAPTKTPKPPVIIPTRTPCKYK